MIRPIKVLVYLACVSLLILFFACSPPDPIVGSPGGGDNWRFTKVSGDSQSTALHDTLPIRLVVKLARVNGTAIVNQDIRFQLVFGSGQVQKPLLNSEVFELVTPTDFAGMATAQFLNFGGDPATGISNIQAEVIDSPLFNVLFTVNTSP